MDKYVGVCIGGPFDGQIAGSPSQVLWYNYIDRVKTYAGDLNIIGATADDGPVVKHGRYEWETLNGVGFWRCSDFDAFKFLISAYEAKNKTKGGKNG